MGLYRFSVSIVGRSNTGLITTRSAVAAAAYPAREALFDEQRQRVIDFSERVADLVTSEILLPEHAPSRWLDRQTLWNEVEARERQVNSQLARAVVLTLPRELGLEVGADLAREFFLRAFVDRGMVADMAVHRATASDGEPQPHAHALLTTRKIVDGAFGLKERAWNGVERLREWRQEWADTANRKLAEHGVSTKLDHRRWFDVSRAATKVRDAGRVVKVVAIMGAAATTQAIRDAARRLVRRERRREAVPLDAAKQQTPLDVLREELRRPMRLAAVGVAAGARNHGEELDKLITDHLLPAVKKHPELEPRFEELEERLGDAFAKNIARVQAQISNNATILRDRAEQRKGLATTQGMRDVARSQGVNRSDRVKSRTGDTVRRTFEREGVVSESVGRRRDDTAYITQVADRLGVPRDADVDRLMATPEVRAMEAQVQDRISASATGEVGRLSVDRSETTQARRDRARQAVPTQTQDAGAVAARAAQSAERSHQPTLG